MFASLVLAVLAIPVIANVTGRPYPAGEVRETLARQIGASVRWLDSVLFLLGEGVGEPVGGTA